jgi:hypothetical protein
MLICVLPLFPAYLGRDADYGGDGPLLKYLLVSALRVRRMSWICRS